MRRGPKSKRRRGAPSNATSPDDAWSTSRGQADRVFRRSELATSSRSRGLARGSSRDNARSSLWSNSESPSSSIEQIDDVERGSNDSDWQPAKDAAQTIAYAEDRAIFEGYSAAAIDGIRQATSNPIMTLPVDVRQYPDAIAQALSQLRLVGVNGPYAVVLGADAYTALSETVDNGYPVLDHVKKLVKDEIIWAPAIDGAFVLTKRGGDFDLHIGQDVSIGYLSHTDTAVRLYLQETLTFLMLTSEAAVALAPPAAKPIR
jgi:uncharacterized linocin/CFP29 family protein